MSIYFIYSDKFHDQMDGAAMESPLVPIIDNFCTDHCVQQAPSTAIQKPSYWYRHVNDIFVVWSHGMEELSNFQGHPNSIHPNIMFTLESVACYHSLLYWERGNLAPWKGHTVCRKSRILIYTSILVSSSSIAEVCHLLNTHPKCQDHMQPKILNEESQENYQVEWLQYNQYLVGS